MKKGNKTFVWVFVIVVLAVGLLGYRNFFGGGNSSGGIPCINPALPIPANLHIHPELKIVIDRVPANISANIGLEPIGCERALHTHNEPPVSDGFRQLHIEPNFPQDFTLGQFFALWGKPFSKTQILDSFADPEHEIVMTVDGQPSEEYENLILKDKQQIVIEYKKVGE